MKQSNLGAFSLSPTQFNFNDVIFSLLVLVAIVLLGYGWRKDQMLMQSHFVPVFLERFGSSAGFSFSNFSGRQAVGASAETFTTARLCVLRVPRRCAG